MTMNEHDMTDAKHTPGPWWFDDRRDKPVNAGGGGVLILGRHRGEGSSFCVASLNHQFEIGSVLPNARLLAALLDAMPSIRSILTCAASGDWRGVLIEADALNRHAIAMNGALLKVSPQADALEGK